MWYSNKLELVFIALYGLLMKLLRQDFKEYSSIFELSSQKIGEPIRVQNNDTINDMLITNIKPYLQRWQMIILKLQNSHDSESSATLEEECIKLCNSVRKLKEAIVIK